MQAGYFDRRAATYHRAAQAGLWGWQRRREAAAILALAGPMAGRSVLDLGAGAGHYARLAVDHGAGSVVAVDRSPAMAAQIPPPITAIVADAASLRLDRRFDLILALGLLEFVADPAMVVAQAAAHLKDSGRLVLLVPPNNPAGWAYGLFHRSHGVDIRLFSPSCVADMARSSGLGVSRRLVVAPYSAVYALEP